MQFQWPIDKPYRYISGYDFNPPSHGAQDFGTPNDANYREPQDGVIVAIRYGIKINTMDCDLGYGNFIETDHGDGWRSLGAHLGDIFVKVGDKVKIGQLVGKTNNTGCSSGPHLHFFLKLNGSPRKPTDYLFDNIVPTPPPVPEVDPPFISGAKAKTTTVVEKLLNIRDKPGGIDIGDILPGTIIEVFGWVSDGNNKWWQVRAPGLKFPILGYAADLYFGEKYLELVEE